MSRTRAGLAQAHMQVSHEMSLLQFLLKMLEENTTVAIALAQGLMLT